MEAGSFTYLLYCALLKRNGSVTCHLFPLPFYRWKGAHSPIEGGSIQALKNYTQHHMIKKNKHNIAKTKERKERREEKHPFKNQRSVWKANI
jgi:hypothetical protein